MDSKNIEGVKDILDESSLHTVCQSAQCPNIFECFSKRTATFMLMGDVCTRNCGFCGVTSGKPGKLDEGEPERVAKAAKEMGLKYVVVTSVTRDDLPDGGAAHFAKTIKEIKKFSPGSKVECLIPDFKGDLDCLKVVLDEDLDVLNHNVETIKKNYKTARKSADYNTSLNVLKSAKKIRKNIITKSGFMLGLGEKKEEIIELLSDLNDAECDVLTIGQYLRPAEDNLPVKKYYKPEEFDEVKELSKDFNFKSVQAGIFVRSSYCAKEVLESI